MPEVGLSELILIGLVAFLVLGPERLPEFFGQIGRMVRLAKNWAADLRRQWDEESRAAREPLAEAKKVIEAEVISSSSMMQDDTNTQGAKDT